MSNKDKWGGRVLFLFMGTIFVLPIGYFLSWLGYSFLFPNERVLIGFALPLTFMGTLVVVGELWMIKRLWHMMVNGESDTFPRDHFAEVVYIGYDLNDPSRSPFITSPTAYEPDVPSHILIAEYHMAETPIYHGSNTTIKEKHERTFEMVGEIGI
jgi:hypothetical protein